MDKRKLAIEILVEIGSSRKKLEELADGFQNVATSAKSISPVQPDSKRLVASIDRLTESVDNLADKTGGFAFASEAASLALDKLASKTESAPIKEYANQVSDATKETRQLTRETHNLGSAFMGLLSFSAGLLSNITTLTASFAAFHRQFIDTNEVLSAGFSAEFNEKLILRTLLAIAENREKIVAAFDSITKAANNKLRGMQSTIELITFSPSKSGVSFEELNKLPFYRSPRTFRLAELSAQRQAETLASIEADFYKLFSFGNLKDLFSKILDAIVEFLDRPIQFVKDFYKRLTQLVNVDNVKNFFHKQPDAAAKLIRESQQQVFDLINEFNNQLNRYFDGLNIKVDIKDLPKGIAAEIRKATTEGIDYILTVPLKTIQRGQEYLKSKVFHEMAHIIELSNAELLEENIKFINNTLKKINKKVLSSVEASELSKLINYAQRVYTNSGKVFATELLSVGVEILNRPSLYKQAKKIVPEFINYIESAIAKIKDKTISKLKDNVDKSLQLLSAEENFLFERDPNFLLKNIQATKERIREIDQAFERFSRETSNLRKYDRFLKPSSVSITESVMASMLKIHKFDDDFLKERIKGLLFLIEEKLGSFIDNIEKLFIGQEAKFESVSPRAALHRLDYLNTIIERKILVLNQLYAQYSLLLDEFNLKNITTFDELADALIKQVTPSIPEASINLAKQKFKEIMDLIFLNEKLTDNPIVGSVGHELGHAVEGPIFFPKAFIDLQTGEYNSREAENFLETIKHIIVERSQLFESIFERIKEGSINPDLLNALGEETAELMRRVDQSVVDEVIKRLRYMNRLYWDSGKVTGFELFSVPFETAFYKKEAQEFVKLIFPSIDSFRNMIIQYFNESSKVIQKELANKSSQEQIALKLKRSYLNFIEDLINIFEQDSQAIKAKIPDVNFRTSLYFGAVEELFLPRLRRVKEEYLPRARNFLDAAEGFRLSSIEEDALLEEIRTTEEEIKEIDRAFQRLKKKGFHPDKYKRLLDVSSVFPSEQALNNQLKIYRFDKSLHQRIKAALFLVEEKLGKFIDNINRTLIAQQIEFNFDSYRAAAQALIHPGLGNELWSKDVLDKLVYLNQLYAHYVFLLDKMNPKKIKNLNELTNAVLKMAKPKIPNDLVDQARQKFEEIIETIFLYKDISSNKVVTSLAHELGHAVEYQFLFLRGFFDTQTGEFKNQLAEDFLATIEGIINNRIMIFKSIFRKVRQGSASAELINALGQETVELIRRVDQELIDAVIERLEYMTTVYRFHDKPFSTELFSVSMEMAFRKQEAQDLAKLIFPGLDSFRGLILKYFNESSEFIQKELAKGAHQDQIALEAQKFYLDFIEDFINIFEQDSQVIKNKLLGVDSGIYFLLENIGNVLSGDLIQIKEQYLPQARSFLENKTALQSIEQTTNELVVLWRAFTKFVKDLFSSLMNSLNILFGGAIDIPIKRVKARFASLEDFTKSLSDLSVDLYNSLQPIPEKVFREAAQYELEEASRVAERIKERLAEGHKQIEELVQARQDAVFRIYVNSLWTTDFSKKRNMVMKFEAGAAYPAPKLKNRLEALQQAFHFSRHLRFTDEYEAKISKMAEELALKVIALDQVGQKVQVVGHSTGSYILKRMIRALSQLGIHVDKFVALGEIGLDLEKQYTLLTEYIKIKGRLDRVTKRTSYRMGGSSAKIIEVDLRHSGTSKNQALPELIKAILDNQEEKIPELVQKVNEIQRQSQVAKPIDLTGKINETLSTTIQANRIINEVVELVNEFNDRTSGLLNDIEISFKVGGSQIKYLRKGLFSYVLKLPRNVAMDVNKYRTEIIQTLSEIANDSILIERKFPEAIKAVFQQKGYLDLLEKELNKLIEAGFGNFAERFREQFRRLSYYHQKSMIDEPDIPLKLIPLFIETEFNENLKKFFEDMVEENIRKSIDEAETFLPPILTSLYNVYRNGLMHYFSAFGRVTPKGLQPVAAYTKRSSGIVELKEVIDKEIIEVIAENIWEYRNLFFRDGKKILELALDLDIEDTGMSITKMIKDGELRAGILKKMEASTVRKKIAKGIAVFNESILGYEAALSFFGGKSLKQLSDYIWTATVNPWSDIYKRQEETIDMVGEEIRKNASSMEEVFDELTRIGLVDTVASLIEGFFKNQLIGGAEVTLRNIIDGIDKGLEKIVLVGHSGGGATNTLIAEGLTAYKKMLVREIAELERNTLDKTAQAFKVAVENIRKKIQIINEAVFIQLGSPAIISNLIPFKNVLNLFTMDDVDFFGAYYAKNSIVLKNIKNHNAYLVKVTEAMIEDALRGSTEAEMELHQLGIKEEVRNLFLEGKTPKEIAEIYDGVSKTQKAISMFLDGKSLNEIAENIDGMAIEFGDRVKYFSEKFRELFSLMTNALKKSFFGDQADLMGEGFDAGRVVTELMAGISSWVMDFLGSATRFLSNLMENLLAAFGFTSVEEALASVDPSSGRRIREIIEGILSIRSLETIDIEVIRKLYKALYDLFVRMPVLQNLMNFLVDSTKYIYQAKEFLAALSTFNFRLAFSMQTITDLKRSLDAFLQAAPAFRAAIESMFGADAIDLIDRFLIALIRLEDLRLISITAAFVPLGKSLIITTKNYMKLGQVIDEFNTKLGFAGAIAAGALAVGVNPLVAGLLALASAVVLNIENFTEFIDVASNLFSTQRIVDSFIRTTDSFRAALKRRLGIDLNAAEIAKIEDPFLRLIEKKYENAPILKQLVDKNIEKFIHQQREALKKRGRELLGEAPMFDWMRKALGFGESDIGEMILGVFGRVTDFGGNKAAQNWFEEFNRAIKYYREKAQGIQAEYEVYKVEMEEFAEVVKDFNKNVSVFANDVLPIKGFRGLSAGLNGAIILETVYEELRRRLSIGEEIDKIITKLSKNKLTDRQIQGNIEVYRRLSGEEFILHGEAKRISKLGPRLFEIRGIKEYGTLMRMEKAEGQNLLEFLSRQVKEFNRLAENASEEVLAQLRKKFQERTQVIFEELGKRIREMHEAEIVHKDLNLRNIFLQGGEEFFGEGELQFKISFIDFDSSQITDEIDRISKTMMRSFDLRRLFYSDNVKVRELFDFLEREMPGQIQNLVATMEAGYGEKINFDYFRKQFQLAFAELIEDVNNDQDRSLSILLTQVIANAESVSRFITSGLRRIFRGFGKETRIFFDEVSSVIDDFIRGVDRNLVNVGSRLVKAASVLFGDFSRRVGEAINLIGTALDSTARAKAIQEERALQVARLQGALSDLAALLRSGATGELNLAEELNKITRETKNLQEVLAETGDKIRIRFDEDLFRKIKDLKNLSDYRIVVGEITNSFKQAVSELDAALEAANRVVEGKRTKVIDRLREALSGVQELTPQDLKIIRLEDGKIIKTYRELEKYYNLLTQVIQLNRLAAGETFVGTLFRRAGPQDTENVVTLFTEQGAAIPLRPLADEGPRHQRAMEALSAIRQFYDRLQEIKRLKDTQITFLVEAADFAHDVEKLNLSMDKFIEAMEIAGHKGTFLDDLIRRIRDVLKDEREPIDIVNSLKEYLRAIKQGEAAIAAAGVLDQDTSVRQVFNNLQLLRKEIENILTKVKEFRTLGDINFSSIFRQVYGSGRIEEQIEGLQAVEQLAQEALAATENMAGQIVGATTSTIGETTSGLTQMLNGLITRIGLWAKSIVSVIIKTIVLVIDTINNLFPRIFQRLEGMLFERGMRLVKQFTDGFKGKEAEKLLLELFDPEEGLALLGAAAGQKYLDEFSDVIRSGNKPLEKAFEELRTKLVDEGLKIQKVVGGIVEAFKEINLLNFLQFYGALDDLQDGLRYVVIGIETARDALRKLSNTINALKVGELLQIDSTQLRLLERLPVALNVKNFKDATEYFNAAFAEYAKLEDRVNYITTLFANQGERVRVVGSEIEAEIFRISRAVRGMVPAEAIGDALYNAFSAFPRFVEDAERGVSRAGALTESALKITAAAGGDAATNMRALAQTMIAYGMSSEMAAEMAGKLLEIQNQGITTIPEYAQYIGALASQARAAGVSFEELAAVFAGLTQFMRTEQAAEGIRGILNELMGGLREGVEEELSLAQIDVSRATISKKGLVQVIQEIADSAGIENVFGDRIAKRTAAAILQARDAIAAAMQSVGEAGASSLEQALASRTQGFIARLQAVMERARAVNQEFGSLFADAFQGALVPLERFVSTMENLPLAAKQFIGGLIQAQVAVGNLFSAIVSLIGGISKMVAIFALIQLVVGVFNRFNTIKMVREFFRLGATLESVTEAISKVIGFKIALVKASGAVADATKISVAATAANFAAFVQGRIVVTGYTLALYGIIKPAQMLVATFQALNLTLGATSKQFALGVAKVTGLAGAAIILAGALEEAFGLDAKWVTGIGLLVTLFHGQLFGAIKAVAGQIHDAYRLLNLFWKLATKAQVVDRFKAVGEALEAFYEAKAMGASGGEALKKAKEAINAQEKLANAAAQQADTAATIANTAAETANTAATQANSAAQTANTAAVAADTGAKMANTAATTKMGAVQAAVAAKTTFLTKVVLGLQGAFGAVMAFIKAKAAALAILGGKITLVILAVASLIAIFVAATNRGNKFSKQIREMERQGEAASRAIDKMKASLGQVGEEANQTSNKIGRLNSGLLGLLEKIYLFLRRIPIAGHLITLIEGVAVAFGRAAKEIGFWVKAISNAAGDRLFGLIKFIDELIDKFGALQVSVKAAWETIKFLVAPPGSYGQETILYRVVVDSEIESAKKGIEAVREQLRRLGEQSAEVVDVFQSNNGTVSASALQVAREIGKSYDTIRQSIISMREQAGSGLDLAEEDRAALEEQLQTLAELEREAAQASQDFAKATDAASLSLERQAEAMRSTIDQIQHDLLVNINRLKQEMVEGFLPPEAFDRKALEAELEAEEQKLRSLQQRIQRVKDEMEILDGENIEEAADQLADLENQAEETLGRVLDLRQKLNELELNLPPEQQAILRRTMLEAEVSLHKELLEGKISEQEIERELAALRIQSLRAQMQHLEQLKEANKDAPERVAQILAKQAEVANQLSQEMGKLADVSARLQDEQNKAKATLEANLSRRMAEGSLTKETEELIRLQFSYNQALERQADLAKQIQALQEKETLREGEELQLELLKQKILEQQVETQNLAYQIQEKQQALAKENLERQVEVYKTILEVYHEQLNLQEKEQELIRARNAYREAGLELQLKELQASQVEGTSVDEEVTQRRLRLEEQLRQAKRESAEQEMRATQEIGLKRLEYRRLEQELAKKTAEFELKMVEDKLARAKQNPETDPETLRQLEQEAELARARADLQEQLLRNIKEEIGFQREINALEYDRLQMEQQVEAELANQQARLEAVEARYREIESGLERQVELEQQRNRILDLRAQILQARARANPGDPGLAEAAEQARIQAADQQHRVRALELEKEIAGLQRERAREQERLNQALVKGEQELVQAAQERLAAINQAIQGKQEELGLTRQLGAAERAAAERELAAKQTEERFQRQIQAEQAVADNLALQKSILEKQDEILRMREDSMRRFVDLKKQELDAYIEINGFDEKALRMANEIREMELAILRSNIARAEMQAKIAILAAEEAVMRAQIAKFEAEAALAKAQSEGADQRLIAALTQRVALAEQMIRVTRQLAAETKRVAQETVAAAQKQYEITAKTFAGQKRRDEVEAKILYKLKQQKEILESQNQLLQAQKEVNDSIKNLYDLRVQNLEKEIELFGWSVERAEELAKAEQQRYEAGKAGIQLELKSKLNAIELKKRELGIAIEETKAKASQPGLDPRKKQLYQEQINNMEQQIQLLDQQAQTEKEISKEKEKQLDLDTRERKLQREHKNIEREAGKKIRKIEQGKEISGIQNEILNMQLRALELKEKELELMEEIKGEGQSRLEIEEKRKKLLEEIKKIEWEMAQLDVQKQIIEAEAEIKKIQAIREAAIVVKINPQTGKEEVSSLLSEEKSQSLAQEEEHHRKKIEILREFLQTKKELLEQEKLIEEKAKIAEQKRKEEETRTSVLETRKRIVGMEQDIIGLLISKLEKEKELAKTAEEQQAIEQRIAELKAKQIALQEKQLKIEFELFKIRQLKAIEEARRNNQMELVDALQQELALAEELLNVRVQTNREIYEMEKRLERSSRKHGKCWFRVSPVDPLPFSTGGIVPGSGNRDTVPAVLTPGEVILNRGQQRQLAENIMRLSSQKVEMLGQQGGKLGLESQIGKILAKIDEVSRFMKQTAQAAVAKGNTYVVSTPNPVVDMIDLTHKMTKAQLEALQ